MTEFLSKNQITLSITWIVAYVVASLVGSFLNEEIRKQWYYVLIYLFLASVSTVFYYKAFSD